MADKKKYEQKIDLVVETEKAKKQFREFTEDIKINFKSNVQKAFSGVETKSVDKLNKIVSQLSAKKIDSSKYQEFFDKISKAADLAASKISKKYVNAIQRLSKAHQDGKISSREFESRLDKLKIKFSRELPQAVNKFKNSVEKSTLSLKEQTSKVGVVSKSLAAFTKRIGIFFSYRIINEVTQAVGDLAKSAVDLESQFANIQAITNSSDATMSRLRDTILRVGEASKYSTEEIAESTVMLGQAGLNAEEINNVLETTTQLAAGTGSELSNTVDLMTSALAVWGVNSEEASHLSDVMVTGMNRTKATLETFRMAVQYAGATAASLNVNFEELAAVASAASNAGLRASVVGTGLRATMAELISPTKKMIDGLAGLGLKTSDVDIASRGLIPVLKTLRDAGLDASTAYDLFGRRAATFVLAAQGQLDKIDELQLAFTEQGATLKAYGVQMDTISAQATALGNTIKSIASDVLDYFSGIIKGFLNLVNRALKGLRYIFSDKDKFRFSEGQIGLQNDIRSATAFDKYLNGIKEGLEKDEKAGEKLNSVIDKINKQFDTNIEHVDSTKKIADEWERISKAVNSVSQEKISAINLAKEKRSQAILEKELSKGNGLFSRNFNDIQKAGVRDMTTDFVELLRKDEAYKIEDIINAAPDETLKKMAQRASDIANKIFAETGEFAKLPENIIPSTDSTSGTSGVVDGGTGNGIAGGESKLKKLNNDIKETKEVIAETKTEIDTFSAGFGDAIAEMYENYSNRNVGKMVAESMVDGMTDATYSVLSGAETIKDAFANMAKSIIQEISKILIKMAILQTFGLFTGGGNSITESGGVSSSTSFVMNNANGGFIPNFRAAAGSKVRGGVPYRDSVPSMLMPGEYVLKKSAVDALGTNFLNDLNNNAAQTLTNAASSLMEQNPWEESSSEPAVVNVWVVSKEEEAKMGPNDVIATISKDIMTGGQTRRLIQSVVAGRK